MGVNNADFFMPIFSADTWFLSYRYTLRRGNNPFFSGNLSTRTDLVIKFDFVKCTTKTNINSYPDYDEKLDGGLSPARMVKYGHQQNILPWCIQETLK